MPPRKGRRAAGKRKFYKRKPRRSTVNVNRALSPIPQRFITKMKFARDLTTGADGFLRLNLNSTWDPTRSGGGLGPQPYARDQLAGLYNRYRVISVGWRITAPNNGGNIQVGCLPSNEIYSTNIFAEMRENPRTKYFVQHSTGTCQLIKGKVYLPSLVGRTKAQYMADDRYQAQVDANPAEAAILNIGCAATNGGFITTGQTVNVLLEYTVEWFDVKIQTAS